VSDQKLVIRFYCTEQIAAVEIDGELPRHKDLYLSRRKPLKMPKVLWNPVKIVVIVCATQRFKYTALKPIFDNLDDLHNPRQPPQLNHLQTTPPHCRPLPLAPHMRLLLSQVGVGEGVDSEIVVLEGLTVSLGSGTASVVEEDNTTSDS
jgi:hypothetical protein